MASTQAKLANGRTITVDNTQIDKKDAKFRNGKSAYRFGRLCRRSNKSLIESEIRFSSTIGDANALFFLEGGVGGITVGTAQILTNE